MKPYLHALLATVLWVSTTSSDAQDAIKQAVGSDRLYADVIDIAPWGRTGEDGRPAGVYAQIFKRLSEYSGCALEQRLTPIPRAVAEVTRSVAHATIMLDRADLNEGAIDLGEVTKLRIEVWLPKGSKVRTLEDLAGKKVGVLRGPTYHEAFDRDERILKYPVTNSLQQLEMLSKERLDGAIGVRQNFLAAASEMRVDIASFAPPINLTPRVVKLWVAPSLRATACSAGLTKALSDMRRSGEIDRLVAQALPPN